MKNSGRNKETCHDLGRGHVGWADGQIWGGKKEGMKPEHGDVLHMRHMNIWEGKRELSTRMRSSYSINVMSDGWMKGWTKTDVGNKDRLERWMKKE